MVQEVINSHRPHQAAGGVDYRQGVEVVGGHGVADFADARVIGNRFEVLVHDAAELLRRGATEQLLNMYDSKESSRGCLQRRTADEDCGGQGGGELLTPHM